MSTSAQRGIGCRFSKWTGLFGVLLVASMVFGQAKDDADKDDPALRDFNATGALQNSGRYARAGERWVQFIKKYPSDKRLDQVNFFLGICQLQTKKYADAATSFRAVLTKYPKFNMLDSAQLNLGMALYQLAATSKKPADYKLAATEFALVSTKFPQSKSIAKALYFQGESLYLAEDKKGAVEAYKKLVAQQGNSPLAPDAYYALGTTQQELGLDADAVTTYQGFLGNAAYAQHSLAGEIRLRLGMSLFALKKYPEAEAEFAKVAAIAKFPYADLALLRQAQCKMENGKHAESVPLLANLLKTFAESPYRNAALLAQGKCQFLLTKFDLAVPPLDQAWKANVDESAESAYWLGRAQLKLNKPADALAVLEPAVQKYKEGEFAPYLQMTRIDAIYELPARRKETAPLYEAFFKQNPEHVLAPQALYMAALVLLGQEDYTNSRVHAEAFLANAKFAEHQLIPAVMYIAGESHLLALGADPKADAKRAQQLYEQLVAKFPQHERASRSYVRIGWCQYNAKQYDPAVQLLTGSLPKLKDPAHVAEAQLLIGRSHSAAKRDAPAVAAYDAALKAKPDWDRADEVLIAWVQSLRMLKDHVAATQRLNQLKTSYPKSTFLPLAVYQLGEIAQEQKQYDAAITNYTFVLQQYATSEYAAPAAYGQGASYFAKEDYTKTVAALTPLLAKFGDSEVAPRGRYLRGLAYKRLKQYQPAVADLQAYLATKPVGDEAIDARYAQALCQIGLKQFDPAVAGLSALVKEFPKYEHIDKVYYEMAHALTEAKKPAEAVVAFRSLAEQSPDSPLAPEGWFHVGRFHEEAADKLEDATQKTAELVKATDAFTKGVAKAKEPALHEKLQYKLGDMLFRQEKFKEASVILQAQIKEHPTGELLGAGMFLAAESLYRQDLFAVALPLFEQVVAKKVEDYHAQALYRAGASAGSLKNWPVSQTHYTNLTKQYPKFELIEDAQYGLGWAYQNQKKFAEARQTYALLADASSEPAAKARFMLGEIAFEEKKYVDAVESFLYVAVSYPYKEWQALARFEAARCFIELDQKAEAIKSLQIVVDKFPDHPKAKNAAALIVELKK